MFQIRLKVRRGVLGWDGINEARVRVNSQIENMDVLRTLFVLGLSVYEDLEIFEKLGGIVDCQVPKIVDWEYLIVNHRRHFVAVVVNYFWNVERSDVAVLRHVWEKARGLGPLGWYRRVVVLYVLAFRTPAVEVFKVRVTGMLTFLGFSIVDWERSVVVGDYLLIIDVCYDLSWVHVLASHHLSNKNCVPTILAPAVLVLQGAIPALF